MFVATSESSTSWIIDSGASSHMSNGRGDFDEYRELKAPITISVADETIVSAVGVGSVKISLRGRPTIKLTDLLHVPDLDRRLISVPALASKVVQVCFERGVCKLSVNDNKVLSIRQSGKLFVISATQADDVAATAGAAIATSDSKVPTRESAFEEETTREVWHARLGHIPAARMTQVALAVDDLPCRARRPRHPRWRCV